MRLYNFLFVLVLVLVIVFAFANIDSLRTTTQVVIPFFGKQILPMRLYGCVALIVLAAIYSILWYFSSTRQKAKSADYLTKLEETRRTLDEKEASRFAQLQAQLEAATQDILARVGGVAPTPKKGFFSGLTQKETPVPLPSTVQSLEGLVGRIEKVRDELAADIASSEHEILQAIETLKDRR
jgi:hypothetical protein